VGKATVRGTRQSHGQIEYIAVPQAWRGEGWHEALEDIPSDHKLIIVKMKLPEGEKRGTRGKGKEETTGDTKRTLRGGCQMTRRRERHTKTCSSRRCRGRHGGGCGCF